jgi:hypothetical protein
MLETVEDEREFEALDVTDIVDNVDGDLVAEFEAIGFEADFELAVVSRIVVVGAVLIEAIMDPSSSVKNSESD